MTARRLPPWPVLRRLYVDQMMSSQKIGDLYGVSRTSVMATLKRDAERHKVRWPLRPPLPAGPPSKLPSYAVLHRLYVIEGLSTQQIATKYGMVDKEAVAKKLRRGAARNGDPWPLKRNRHDYHRRRALRIGEVAHDSVPARMVRLEILDFCPTYRVTRRDLAEVAGVSPSVVARIASGNQDRVSRRVAHAIVQAIQKYENGKAKPTRQYQPARRTA